MSETIYGRQPVLEVLRAARRNVSAITMVDVRKSSETDEIYRLASKAGISISTSKRADLDRMTEGGHHQGVCAHVSAYPTIGKSELLSIARKRGKSCTMLFLDHIQDPQNTGALVRSAECLGFDAVVLPQDRAAGITPAVVRASAGATEHMNVAVVVNIVRVMKSLKDAGLWFYGMEAIEDATTPWNADFSDASGIVVGSEGKGMTRLVRENCDFILKIPMTGKVSSMNAAASGAVIMYEVMKQKQFNAPK